MSRETRPLADGRNLWVRIAPVLRNSETSMPKREFFSKKHTKPDNSSDFLRLPDELPSSHVPVES